MSDLAWTIIGGIACIIIAYGFGLQFGYNRGYRDACLDQAIKEAEEKAKSKFKNYVNMTPKEIKEAKR